MTPPSKKPGPRMPGVSSKRPTNRYMRMLYDCLTSDGWTASSRGAPDFFCWKEGKNGGIQFCCVEAVRKSTYRLRKHQKAVIDVLARYGIPCFRYNCDTGAFEQITFRPPQV